MKFLHSMVRVFDLEQSIDFFVNKLGLIETRRKEFENGRFTLIFLKAPQSETEVELTYNWDNSEQYSQGKNFGHLAFAVDNIYETCEKLQNEAVTILRPPRDGRMAFVKSPDGISVELLQDGEALDVAEPWKSMQSTGDW